MVTIYKNNCARDPKKQFDNDHDDFGLPEVNYSPIEREDYTPPVFEPPTYYSDQQQEETQKGWIVAVVTLVLLVIGWVIYLL